MADREQNFERKAPTMRTLRAGLTALAAATLLLVALPGLASAATTGTTTTTFTLTGGSISITAPSTTVNLGPVSASASSLTGHPGSGTLPDSRALLRACG